MTSPEQLNALAHRVVTVYTEAGLTLACAESLTAGLVSATIAEVPGASAVLRGGVTAYATDVKRDVLGVDGSLLAARGAVDPTVAQGMARGAAHLLHADVGVATTGVAGPSEQDGQPVGTIYVAAFRATGDVDVREGLHLGDLGREELRRRAVVGALQAALEAVGR